MAKINIGNRTEVFTPAKADSTYVLADGKSISSVGNGIQLFQNLEGLEFRIAGTIDANDFGFRMGAAMTPISAMDIEIAKTGSINVNLRAIELFGDGHTVRNAGLMQGADGIQVSGDDTTIVNSGRIVANDDAVAVVGSATIVNSGRIDGGYGISMTTVESSEGMELRNSGRIIGDSYAVYGSGYADRVVNAGTLDGYVFLGGGEDTFVFKGGKITEVVDGGTDGDRYIVRADGAKIEESSGGGHDVVFASVSYTLGDYIEQLNLTGKRNIDATGNAQGNHLQGNSGANDLRGEGGMDFLVGMGGNDRLFGGTGADYFNFQPGSGRDTVMDFEIGIDEIQIGGLKGATDFTDMINNHTVQKGDDVWITYGDDTVVIKDTDKADLLTGDFVF